jgi:hypothetical protein
MGRVTLFVAGVLSACLVLAGTAYADETETPTPVAETPPPVETAVAPPPVETPSPAAETPVPPDEEASPAAETPPPVEETPRPVEPGPPATAAPDEGEVIAPAPVEPAPGTPEAVIGVPPTGAGSASGSSWPWWPLAVAGAAVAGTAGVLLAYQGRRAKP